jgi:hypothetical protein
LSIVLAYQACVHAFTHAPCNVELRVSMGGWSCLSIFHAATTSAQSAVSFFGVHVGDFGGSSLYILCV